MKKNVLHLHLTRTGGKSICSAILRSKKFRYIQASKFFSNNKLKLSTNKEKINDLLFYLKGNKSSDKPYFITGHFDLDPYFFANDYKIFTVLRNPFNRLKSQLSSITDFANGDPAYEEIIENFSDLNNIIEYPKESILKIRQSKLSNFNKETLLLLLNNGQSRQISNISYKEDISDNDLLDLVLDRLDKIDFICTSENLKLNYSLLKNFLNLPFYYHLPGINISSTNKFMHSENNKEFFHVNKVDYFIWRSISIFEKNLNNKTNFLSNLEENDRFIYSMASSFKQKIIKLFAKFRESTI